MKTKLFILSACAGFMMLASCSAPGPSAESKAKVAAFDSAWTAMGSSAMAWGDSLTQALTMCESACSNGAAMECCEHMQGKKDSLMMPCMNDMKAFQDMKSKWDAEMPMWNELQTKLDTLKANVANGKATDEQINSTLAELQGAADKGATEMGPWMESFNAARAACKNNMMSGKMGWEASSCTDKKCVAMHKKS